MAIIIGILFIMAMVASFALVIASKEENRKILDEIEAVEELARENRSEHKESPDLLREPHPLESMRGLSAKLNLYLSAIEEKYEDRDALNRFLISKEKVESNLRTLSTERMLLTLHNFEPMMREYGLDLNGCLKRLNHEMSELVFSLGNEPENVFILEKKSSFFQKFENRLFEIGRSYQRVAKHEIPLPQLRLLIDDKHQPSEVQQEASSECAKLINFYYLMHLQNLFLDFQECHFDEIQGEVNGVKDVLDESKHGVDEALARRMEYHKNRLLGLLESYHEWNHHINQCLAVGLEMVVKFQYLKPFVEEGKITAILSQVKNKFLPLSSEFAAEPHNGAKVLKKRFDILNPLFSEPDGLTPLKADLAITIEEYVDSKIADCYLVKTNSLGETLRKNIEYYLRGICDFRINMTS